jgi:hypothetical protein
MQVDARYDTEHSKFVAELSQQSAALAPAVASVSLDIGHGMLENPGTLLNTLQFALVLSMYECWAATSLRCLPLQVPRSSVQQ